MRQGVRQRHFRRAVLGLSAFLALVATLPVYASELSKRLYTKGLVEFHAGRLEQSRELFDRAVAADAFDAYAWYYRGVARARLGDRAGAISDLRRAWELQPKLYAAALDLGIALVEDEQFAAALDPLRQARNDPELDATASLYIGISLFRLQQPAEARQYLTWAFQRDSELEAVARYYLGVLNYQQAHWRRATAEFQRVVALRPASPVAEQARQFLARLARLRRQRWTIFGALGFQYDSNVILAPASDFGAAFAKSDVGVTRQQDGRATIQTGAYYQVGRSRTAEITAGYEFYQSLHLELRSFDLQDHRVQVSIADRRFWGHWGVVGRYDYFYLDGDDFLREGSVAPYLRILEGDVGWTELLFQLRRRDFLDPAFHIRDATNYIPSVVQTLLWKGDPKRYLTLAYAFEVEETEPGRLSRAFAYTAQQIGGGVHWELPWAIEAGLDYAFRHKVYDRAPSLGRRDQEHRIILLARRHITEHIGVTAGYLGQWNLTNSTQLIGVRQEKLFEYERHIGSVAIEARY